MKRLLAGLLISGFLSLVGVQTFHFHDSHEDSASPASCALCVLGHQAARHAPPAYVALAPLSSWVKVAQPETHRIFVVCGSNPSARAPPLA